MEIKPRIWYDLSVQSGFWEVTTLLIKDDTMGEHITEIEPLNTLIKEKGIVEYIRDYYAAVNSRLSIIYETEDFYIAEDNTFQP